MRKIVVLLTVALIDVSAKPADDGLPFGIAEAVAEEKKPPSPPPPLTPCKVKRGKGHNQEIKGSCSVHYVVTLDDKGKPKEGDHRVATLDKPRSWPECRIELLQKKNQVDVFVVGNQCDLTFTVRFKLGEWMTIVERSEGSYKVLPTKKQ